MALPTWLRRFGFSTLVIAGLLVALIGTVNPVAAAGPGNRQTLVAPAELNNAETDALLFMVEEEKLARDVYTVWAETWEIQEFARIAVSEQRHMDAVARLLDRYGLADPTEGKTPGEFVNKDLQAMYDQLIAEGSVSAEAAIQTGVTIEEVDIADLDARLPEVTPNDIRRVFTNLRRGSTHHLAAFQSLLD